MAGQIIKEGFYLAGGNSGRHSGSGENIGDAAHLAAYPEGGDPGGGVQD